MNAIRRNIIGLGKELGFARITLGALALLLPALVALSAESDTPSTQPAAKAQPTQAAIEEMVKNLGAASWREREDAQNALVGAGAPAVEELEKALKTDDAEVRQRAETALAAIRKNLAEGASEAAARGRIWKSPVKEGVASPAAAGEGVVCFLAGDGTLRAVDAKTGKPKWTFEDLDKDAHAGNGNQFIVGAPSRPAPVIAGGLVFVSAQLGRLFAIDLATGEAKWKSASTEGFAPPVAAGGKVFAAGTYKDVHAMDSVTGKEIWNCSLEAGSAVRPAVSGSKVYVAARDNAVYAIDADTGAKKKLAENLADATDLLVTKGGDVVVRTSEAVVCLDGEGKQKWALALAAAGGNTGGAVFQLQAVMVQANAANGTAAANNRAPVRQPSDATLAAIDGTLYAVAAGQVHAIESASGKELWSYKPASKEDAAAGGGGAGNAQVNVQVGGAVVIGGQGRVFMRGMGMSLSDLSLPCVDGGTMFVASPAGLHAVDLKTRQELWRLESKQQIAARPVVIDGVLYYGTSDQISANLGGGAGVFINNGQMMKQVQAPNAAPQAAGAAGKAQDDDAGPVLNAIKLKTAAK
jgi:outer membrane protein assembly factor BamB